MQELISVISRNGSSLDTKPQDTMNLFKGHVLSLHQVPVTIELWRTQQRTEAVAAAPKMLGTLFFF